MSEDLEFGKEMENGEDGLSPQEEAAVRANPALFLTRSLLSIEKLRVATQVRDKHLKRNKKEDSNTEIILTGLVELEDKITDLLGDFVKDHPAYHWFSGVKGIGNENIGKVVGFLDIQKANYPSSFWKFAGYHVTADNKAPKAMRGGGKLEYNKVLRVMCYRLGTSLMKARGKFATRVYEPYKEGLKARYEKRGWKVVKATELPRDARGKRYEAEGVISEGHIHQMAIRKMIKVFLACLHIVWREAEGLPVSRPYAHDQLHHQDYINPWSLCDRPPKKARRAKKVV